eukprot:CAMPEP_0119038494 /NCGR_PEP_ID=MMETSP1177-20130426/7454_1 /TAXON_ID=2985 /ORGANISM="Ochromonas sp, Strain CCMP1899" /LENGTH=232 /DNA_ID=CAMNT_0007001155 /DNA_START=138 /DNA_END=836 /DNA_ORIENTATION=-
MTDNKEAYSKAGGKGKLSFKGVKAPKKHLKRVIDEDDSAREIANEESIKETRPSSNVKTPAVEEIKILLGSGRMTSSGTTILGIDTKFMDELHHGDAIIVTHPNTYLDETKIVRMVLSNISISVSSAFSTDLITTAAFRYIKAPRDPNASNTEEEDEGSKKRRMMTGKGQQDSEEAAFGEYVSQGGTQATYRVRIPGPHKTYKMVTTNTKKEVSREDLLYMRSKQKGDRHCG